MDVKIKFGERVRELRKEKNLSQERLAHLASIDRTYLPSIEKGKRNVSISVIEKIATALQISIGDLMKDL